MSLAIDNLQQIRSAWSDLAKTELVLGNPELAFDYLDRAKDIEEKIFSSESARNLAVLESQFGKDSIVINYEEASVTVNSNSYMYAVSSPKFEGWKFINDDDSMGQLAKNIIPSEVISALKK